MEPSSNGALKASVLPQCTDKTRDLAVRAQEREDRSEIALFLVMRVHGADTGSSHQPAVFQDALPCCPLPTPRFLFSAKGIFWKPSIPK